MLKMKNVQTFWYGLKSSYALKYYSLSLQDLSSTYSCWDFWNTLWGHRCGYFKVFWQNISGVWVCVCVSVCMFVCIDWVIFVALYDTGIRQWMINLSSQIYSMLFSTTISFKLRRKKIVFLSFDITFFLQI